MSTVPLPPADLAADDAARRAVVTDLVTPMLVEAGAGSGKTTLLVARILALVARGVPVHAIAAITFTRKAAAELRERVLRRLDEELRGIEGKGECPWDRTDVLVRARFTDAMASLDRMYLGTIHGFCARLLRERPVEAQLDPTFTELDEPAARADLRAFWADFLAAAARRDDPRLRALHEAGIDLAQLEESFAARVAQGDATFASEPWPVPVVTRELVERLCACVHDTVSWLRARGLHPESEGTHFDRWDRVMAVSIALEGVLEAELAEWRAQGALAGEPGATTRSGARWSEVIARTLDCDQRKDKRFTVTAWTNGSTRAADKREPKALADAWEAFVTEFAEAHHQAWLAHTYGLVMPVLEEAHRAFRAWRLDTGRLTFDDLLQAAAALLQAHPDARRDLAERWPHLLVDEFQDTDPVQAAVVACLGAVPETAAVTDWRTVRLRGLHSVDRTRVATDAEAEAEALRRGVVVVVGDPKQSIYRFRRADIGTFLATRALIARDGAVLPLVRNFRSVAAIERFVNTAFAGPGGFPAEATASQAAYAPMITTGKDCGRVHRHEIAVGAVNAGKAVIAAAEAPALAAWIAGEIADERRTAGDFMILARTKRALPAYVAELAKVGVPAMVGGADDAPAGAVRELALVFRLLADPADRLLTAAVLEGPCFACTPADLWAAHTAGLVRLALDAGVPDVVRTAAATDERVARVVAGFDTLAAWRAAAVHLAPDELAQRILDDRGLLLHVAADPLGDAEAAALLGAVAVLRAASHDHRTTLDEAVAALEDLMAAGGTVSSLRRGRGGVVRVMSVHASKGLESPVVILAQPTTERERAPRTIVRRDEHGVHGMLAVIPDRGSEAPVALHPAWEDAVADEARLEADESVRLRYVAATRAAEELVIGVTMKNGDVVAGQVWEHFAAIGDGVTPLEPPASAPTVPPATASVAAPLARTAYDAAARPSWSRTTVTRAAGDALREAREDAEEPLPAVAPEPEPPVRAATSPRPADIAARDWGTLVHRALEAAVRGRRGAGLARALRALVRDAGLVERADGRTPRADVIAALEGIVARTMAREEWRDVERATTRLAELPVRFTMDGEDDRPRHVDGVADLVLEVDGAWVVWDWKTDDGDESWWATKRPAYEVQLTMYADELARRLGAPVTWRLVRLA